MTGENRAMEPTHQQILNQILRNGEDQRIAHATLSGEMKGRFDGLDREIAGIRTELSSTGGRVSVLEGGHGHDHLPTGVEAIEEGLPFSRGWARNLGVAAIVVAALGGLKAAFGAVVQIVHALIIAGAQFLQPPH